MSILTVMMLTITASVAAFMIPRIYGDWLRFWEYFRAGEREKLLALQSMENGWALRHFVCALLAVIMAAVIKGSPLVEEHARLPEVTAAYAMISLLFSFAESLFAQRIAAVTEVMEKAGKDRHRGPR